MSGVQTIIQFIRNNHRTMQQLTLAGIWSLVEQGLFSGSTFVINVLLIRWLSETGYGAYTLAFAVLVFASGFYNAMLFEPTAVHGPSTHRDHFVRYARMQMGNFYAFSVGVSLVLLLLASITWVLSPNAILWQAFLGVAIGQAGMLSLWMVRRLYYVRQQVAALALITGLHAVCQVLMLLVLYEIGRLTLLTVFIGPAFSTLVISLLGVWMLREQALATEPVSEALTSRSIWIENWQYGNWLILSAVLIWLSTNAYFVIVGVVLSVEDSGTLKALQNFTLPAAQFTAAAGLLYLPFASQQMAANGIARLQRLMMQYTLFIIFATSMYFALLLIINDVLFDVLYSGQYQESANLIPFLGLQVILASVVTSWSIGLRIGYGTRYTFLLDAMSTIVVFTVGVYLTYAYGLQGTVIGMLCSTGVRVVGVLALWHLAGRRAAHEQILAKGDIKTA